MKGTHSPRLQWPLPSAWRWTPPCRYKNAPQWPLLCDQHLPVEKLWDLREENQQVWMQPCARHCAGLLTIFSYWFLINSMPSWKYILKNWGSKSEINSPPWSQSPLTGVKELICNIQSMSQWGPCYLGSTQLGWNPRPPFFKTHVPEFVEDSNK